MSVEKSLQREQNAEVIEEAREVDAEVAVYQLLDMQASGMIREGTEDLPEPDQLIAPGYRSILIDSAYRVRKTKKEGGGWKRTQIRFRHGCESIDPRYQDEHGYGEGNPVKDKILFKNGTIVIVRDNDTVGLFDFMRKDSRNTTNPDRLPSAPGVYREIFPEKENEDGNTEAFEKAQAIVFIQGLILDQTPGKLQYDEHRLSALAQYFGVVADSPGARIKGLIAVAGVRETFLREARAFESKMLTDIAHAEKLGIIKFEDNRVILVAKNSVLFTYSKALKQEQRYHSLSGYFHSPEGMSKYKEFDFELQETKRKNIE